MVIREGEDVQTISIVVPVYQGELTLEPLLAEITPLTTAQLTPGGVQFRVSEVILVNDGAIDNSERVMSALADKLPFVTPIWLARNFGQHPATLAGIVSTNGDWVVSLDEDGQHDPCDIVRLLDVAVANDVQLVYAYPTNTPPHGRTRNFFSNTSKKLFTGLLGHGHIGEFNSFRLIRGEIARALAAYCGHGIYLDVALSWVVNAGAHCPVLLRAERGRTSGYSFRKLARHFRQLLLTSGTAPLRLVAFIGISSVLLGIVVSVYSLWGQADRASGCTGLGVTAHRG
jgi:polyisoprenyl-phosphate glycosyltransferase